MRSAWSTLLRLVLGANAHVNPNIIPPNYATFNGSALPPFTAVGCAVAQDAATTYGGSKTLKVTVNATNATLAFGSANLSLTPYAMWILSFFARCTTLASADIIVTTAAGTYTTGFSFGATATWDQFFDAINMVADGNAVFGLSLSFPNCVGSIFNFTGFGMQQTASGQNVSPPLGTIGGTPGADLGSAVFSGTLPYANNSGQVTQVVGNNAGNGQLNVSPAGGVSNNLPHANTSTQTLQVIANVGGNGQLNVSPTGGVINALPYSNHDTAFKDRILTDATLKVDGTTGPVSGTLPYSNHATQVTTTITSAPDSNGSLLAHGTVYDPHISGGQIKWRHFFGDTSGDDVTNLADGLNKRFLHGAMSGPVQGTVNLNVDTFGSYLGHGTVFQPHISAGQIGFGHFKGDTSGNYSTAFIDGANLRLLHGAMSGATQNTVAGTADSNGSYLQHGVVFNPHLTGGAVGWKNLLGDTSGDTTTNLIDAANKRFLHGAMSTGVQGVISSGAQLTVNPSGGVSGTLPYTNHDISFRNVISSGSQLNVNPTGGVTSTLPYANHDTSFRNVISSGSQLTVNPTGGVAGTLPYLNHDVSFRNVISSGSQVNVNPTGGVTGNLPYANHDISVRTAINSSAQVLNLYGKDASVVKNQSDTWLDPRATNSRTIGHSLYGWFDIVQNSGTTGRGSYELELSNSGTQTPFRLKFITHVDWAYNATLSLLGSAAVDISGILSQAVLLKDNTTGYTHLMVYAPSVASDWTLDARLIFNSPSGAVCTLPFTNVATATGTPSGYTLLSTVDLTKTPTLAVSVGATQIVHSNLLGGVGTPGSGLKAYINASDTTAGGHSGTWQHSFMSTGVQSAIASSGSLVNVCAALNNTEQGTAFDGSAVTFLTAFPAGTTPIIVYLPGGLSYDSTLPAGSQQQLFSITGLSNTGFTPVLKIQNLPAAPTNQSVNFTPFNTATNSATATLSVPGGTVIINGQMTVNFSVTLPADSSDTVTVTIAGTQEWSKSLATALNGKTYTYSLPLTNTSAVNGSTVVVADSISGVKATTVTYQTGTNATTHSATPAGSSGVPFIVLPPPT